MSSLILFFFLCLIIIGLPFGFIVSLNTLFDLGIGYGFSEWLSAMFILCVFCSRQLPVEKTEEEDTEK